MSPAEAQRTLAALKQRPDWGILNNSGLHAKLRQALAMHSPPFAPARSR